MIFGNPLNFAVEALVEPGPEYPPSFGRNVAGRMQLIVGGVSVGDISEPSCVPRHLSEHITELCATSRTLWHSSLSGAPPEKQFQMLDEALFLGGGNPELEECHETIFLTNVSEAFDLVKGFVLSPSPDEIVLLLRLDEGGPLIHRNIPYAEFSSVTAAFAHWVTEQERTLLNRATV
jgi:hypothetical protein